MIEILHMSTSMLMKNGFPFIKGTEEARMHFARNVMDFIHVANIDTDDLDEAYMLSNNIDDSWVKNEGVEVAEEGKALFEEQGGFRSSSVGDVFIKNGTFFVVAGMGFEEVSIGKN